jgi:hypothetical protein
MAATCLRLAHLEAVVERQRQQQQRGVGDLSDTMRTLTGLTLT